MSLETAALKPSKKNVMKVESPNMAQHKQAPVPRAQLPDSDYKSLEKRDHYLKR